MIRLIVFFILLSAQSFGQSFIFPAVISQADTGSGGGGGDTLIGPSITWAGKTTYFLGDSWVNGVLASTTANRWTTLFSAGKGTTESNSGVNSVTMSPDSCFAYSFYSKAYIPTYNSGTSAALFIAIGLNDIGRNVPYQSTTRFDSAYSSYLDYAINTRGWPDSLIFLITPGRVVNYNNYICPSCCVTVAATTTRHEAFNTVIQNLATTWSCNFVDIYTPMNTAALGGSYYGDNLHLNDLGMDWYADWLLAHIR